MIRELATFPFAIAFSVAGPVTYIICIVDTWQGNLPVWAKLLFNLTFDAFLGLIWPITWLLWLGMYLMGTDSPASRVLGF